MTGIMNKNSERLSPSCSSSEELVAYLYDEMGADQQSVFETHLAGCDLCTAEFARLSLSRLEVYEWRRDDFAPLAVPHFAIPYEPAKTSWAEAFRTFFAAPSRWVTAAGAFAILTIAAGVWFFMPSSPEIAQSGKPEASPAQTAVRGADSRPIVPVEPKPVEQVTAPKRESPAVEPREPVKIAAREPVRQTVPKPAKTERPGVRTEQAARPARAPRLNDFEDDEDTTLRLGDLLAEVDTTDR